MSTHQLDASGSRTLTTTFNDPARTVATMNAKQSDDVMVTLGNMEYVEIQIPTTPGACEIVTRKKLSRKAKLNERGDYVREDGKIVYEDSEEEILTLRLKSYLTVVGSTDDQTPHTALRVFSLAKETPFFLQGDIISEEKIDLGFGV